MKDVSDVLHICCFFTSTHVAAAGPFASQRVQCAEKAAQRTAVEQWCNDRQARGAESKRRGGVHTWKRVLALLIVTGTSWLLRVCKHTKTGCGWWWWVVVGGRVKQGTRTRWCTEQRTVSFTQRQQQIHNRLQVWAGKCSVWLSADR